MDGIDNKYFQVSLYNTCPVDCMTILKGVKELVHSANDYEENISRILEFAEQRRKELQFHFDNNRMLRLYYEAGERDYYAIVIEVSGAEDESYMTKLKIDSTVHFRPIFAIFGDTRKEICICKNAYKKLIEPRLHSFNQDYQELEFDSEYILLENKSRDLSDLWYVLMKYGKKEDVDTCWDKIKSCQWYFTCFVSCILAYYAMVEGKEEAVVDVIVHLSIGLLFLFYSELFQKIHISTKRMWKRIRWEKGVSKLELVILAEFVSVIKEFL